MNPRKKHNQENRIPIQNRFQLLEDNDGMDMEESNKEEDDKVNTKNSKSPPPLVLHGKIESYSTFTKALKGLLKQNYYVKYHTEFTEVFTTTKEQYELLKEIWHQQELSFHTYTDKNEKRKTFVIKGLHEQTDCQDIKLELLELGYETINVNVMKNTIQPKYMVTMKGNVQLNKLRQSVKHITSTKIEWDNYVNKRRVRQCHRCQTWGHATANCYAKPVCLKCAEQHLTKDCIKSKDTPAKCANCGGDHPANTITCQEYMKRIKILEARSVTTQQRSKQKGKTGSKPIFDLKDHTQYPSLRQRATSMTQRNNVHLVWGQPHSLGARKTPYTDAQHSMQVNSSVNNQHEINNRVTYNPDSNTHVHDFMALAKEINELNTICNIRKMLDTVRNFKNSLQQCKTAGQQFQLLLEFCDKLNNE